MASDQMEYCGECERKEQCRIALQQGKDPHCPYAV